MFDATSLAPLFAILALGVAGVGVAAAEAAKPEGARLLAFIGTYNGPRSEGLYRAWFDPATGRLTAPELAAKSANPSFIALHPKGRFL